MVAWTSQFSLYTKVLSEKKKKKKKMFLECRMYGFRGKNEEVEHIYEQAHCILANQTPEKQNKICI